MAHTGGRDLHGISGVCAYALDGGGAAGDGYALVKAAGIVAPDGPAGDGSLRLIPGQGHGAAGVAGYPEVLRNDCGGDGVGEAVASEVIPLSGSELEGIGLAHGQARDGDVLAGEGAGLGRLSLGLVCEGPGFRLWPVGGEAQDDRAIFRPGDAGEVEDFGLGAGGVGGSDGAG